MLDVVFFPFSHIRRSQLKTLLSVFPCFRYLPLVSRMAPDHPLHPMIEQGRVKPEFHSPEDLESIDSQVKSYRDWAGMHRGNEKNLKALLRDTPYFTDDSDVTRIQSQLRGRVSEGWESGEEKREEKPLLFLKFAGISDSENEKIDDELMVLEQNRSHLLSELKGAQEEEFSSESYETRAQEKDPGEVMTGRRIRSWWQVALEKGVFENREDPLLLVTTSPAVFDHFFPDSKDVINELDIESIKVHEDECPLRQEWQKEASEILEECLREKGVAGKGLPEATDGCPSSAQIKLGIFPEKTSFLDLPDFNQTGKTMGICLVRLNPTKKLDFT